MPTPIEILLDPASLTVIALYALLIAWEAVAPARNLPSIKGWKVRGIVAFTVYFFLSSNLLLLLERATRPLSARLTQCTDRSGH